MQAREAGTVSLSTDREARSERARTRRWAQRLTDLARASEDHPAAAEAACRALAWTERAARELEARRRALERDDS